MLHTRFVVTTVLAAGLLAACDASTGMHDAHAGNAFPMGVPERFDAPPPTKPLFADPIVTAKSVLPPAKADVRAPLPPLAALPQAGNTNAAPANTGDPQKDGAVNSAAGMAAVVSDGQGEGNDQKLGAPGK